MFKLNPLLITDGYKLDHRSQYPEDTEVVYSNGTPRSNRILQQTWQKHDGKYVAVGMEATVRYFIKELFDENFFKQDRNDVCPQYKEIVEDALGPGAITLDHVYALHDLGYLPIIIKALPEGTVAKMKVPFLTIKNTLPEFFWVTNYLETLLSAVTWKPITNATIAREFRTLVDEYAARTGCSDIPTELQCHDFSMRGLSFVEDAVFGAMGHMVYFNGTDTLPVKQALKYFHDAEPMTGVTVPATEHSVMCMGSKDKEIDTFERLLKLYPSGIVSIVSDTWDFWKVLTSYTVLLKELIESRKDIVDEDGNVLVPGRTVFRPDSGDPVKILTGYMPSEYRESSGAYYCRNTGKELAEHEIKGAVEVLYDIFGGDETEEGFKVLNSSVGLIYGDSITLHRCEAILARLAAKGFASCNVVFGIGSYTYQYNTRDTLGIAFKATAGTRGGEHVELFKDPKTDSGTKKSAKGYLKVIDGELYDQQPNDDGGDLEVIFKNGRMVRKTSWNDVRMRAML